MVHGNCVEDVLQDLEGLQIMRVLGKNMSWMLRCIESGSHSGFPAPAPEKKIFTNFIH
jgi:hypothetical protein